MKRGDTDIWPPLAEVAVTLTVTQSPAFTVKAAEGME